jgi:hypothetical protein
MHKQMPGAGRAMALDAGSAAHEAFAAVRVYQLMFHQHHPELAEFHGRKLFGDARYDSMIGNISNTATDRTNIINFTLESLYTSGFYDDPGDKRRTINNISESLIAYIDRWDHDRYPVWIRDLNDPESDVGIEIAFDTVVEITYVIEAFGTQTIHDVAFRLTGKIDGLHTDGDHICIHENKTAARIDDAWLAQWRLSHQITGYTVAATTFAQQDCTRAIVFGMAIPLPRSIGEGGIRRETVNRTPTLINKWVEWLLHTVMLHNTYKDNILEAPTYTHSCNRYFRPCSFVAFCDSDPEEREQILLEMVDDEWSPLEDKVVG